ncbi:PilW family protein [Chromobacterium sp. IIBBL 290-4]|uniref:PilW family protein n=1 Tax=Chromobacterium sp. IIBBL 290-4 TaxID=2953890 RepID=UPI0020B76521|nr:PilW family protein [Chromobacterium sp. IIBBL 290-4]UTH76165.1 PilW family protein [Chromobacterium sp. IIBBL 290-4]
MKRRPRMQGFSMVEMMVAITIGLLLLVALVGTMVAGRKDYSTNAGQGELQNAGATISNLIAQSARGAGFFACSGSSTSNELLTAGSLLGNFSNPVIGYGAVVASSSLALSSLNGSNDGALSDWSPALDSSLQGLVAKGSDVLVLSGQANGAVPVWVSAYASAGATSLQTQSSSTIAVNNVLAVSNCANSTIVQVSGVNSASGVVTVSLAQALDSNYPAGSMAAPLAQTAYFVGQATGSQSALYQAYYDGTTTNWKTTPLVPGVDTMQVWYGIGGASGAVNEYVPAGQVSNWSQVYALRVALLLEGPLGSAPASPNTGSCVNQRQWTVLGNTVTVPCDTRLRHVYTMTVSLRNAGL